jgi:DNA polymerase-3 subunit delta
MFCLCPDGRLIQSAVEERLANHPPAPGKVWERRTFWGDEELPAAFWEALTLQGLFAAPQALVVRDAHNLPAETWRRISAALAAPGALTWPFLCLEGDWEKGQPKVPASVKKLRCFEHAEQQKWIWRQSALDARGVRRYVADAAKRLDLRFAPGAFETLAAALPPDAAAIDNELAKLALLANGDVTPDDAACVEHAPAFDVFAFLRQVQGGQTAMWRTLLQEERRNDALIFPLLGLMQREARLLWRLRAGESPSLHPASAAAKREAAARLGCPGLANWGEAMHTAELAIKSGARTPAQALDALLGELTLIFATR